MSPELRATYRVQLRPGFGFHEVVSLVPFLAELGVSHIYCSPYLQATPGSTHGYDVVDHTHINDELGGPEGHARMCDALGDHGMGHILDVVPNHMAIGGRASVWWWDLLRNGAASPYARFFDIDWDPPEARLKDKILVPVLGDHYGRVLEAGELRLQRDGDEAVVRYQDHEVPIAPGSIESLPGTPTGLDEAIGFVNAEPALLHALLEQQNYRLAHWRTDLELNYRRFFDINQLVALRMEEPEVFDLVHALPLAMIEDGRLDGMRIDHVDGLHNPRAYLQRLRDSAPAAYLIVEKILEVGEMLPEEWPVQGTTGYDFLRCAGGLFVDPAAEEPLTDLYVAFTGEIADLENLEREMRLKIMEEVLPSDIERLVSLLVDICERHPRHRDYTRNELRDALREVIAALDVYRTYTEADEHVLRPQDARRIERVAGVAQSRRPEVDENLFAFIADILLLRYEGRPEADFVMQLQQTTGSVMAKAVEDTVFYNYNRFVALNEVGGAPGVWGTSVEEFHRSMTTALQRWPRSMITTSTHDTKRSEDVRARLAVLTEMPEAWADAVGRWSKLNEPYRTEPFPDRNAEYLLYQALVGAYPLDAERAINYMHKAAREAKRHTSWTAPDPTYEEALETFVRDALSDDAFTSDLDSFVAPLIEPGRVNSLAQTLLKLTCPGVPDTYQGCEVWDLSLVDPDNRRAVDHEGHRALLAACTSVGAAMSRWDEGGPKIFLTTRSLELRARRPGAFAGSYEPLELDGPGAAGAVAFARGGSIAAVVPRLTSRRPPGWGSTTVTLPEGRWSSALTGERVPGRPSLEDLWRGFPVALLVKESP